MMDHLLSEKEVDKYLSEGGNSAKEPQYRTITGLKARIIATDINSRQFPIAVAVTEANGAEVVFGYTAEFNIYADGASSLKDLVLVTEWDDFKVDDPVMVRDSEGSWKKSYFKKVNEDGKPCTFYSGHTRWSSSTPGGYTGTRSWDECRKPTEEELGENDE